MNSEYTYNITLKTTFNSDNMPASVLLPLMNMTESQITEFLAESAISLLNEEFFANANKGNSWATLEAVSN